MKINENLFEFWRLEFSYEIICTMTGSIRTVRSTKIILRAVLHISVAITSYTALFVRMTIISVQFMAIRVLAQKIRDRNRRKTKQNVQTKIQIEISPISFLFHRLF